MAPQYLQDIIVLCEKERDLRVDNQTKLVVPWTRHNTYGDRAFSVAAPYLWNALPEDLRKSENLEFFKQKLKTFLFKE